MDTTSTRWRSRPSGGEEAAASSRPDAAAIRPLVVTTDGLPPHQQFEAWRDLCVPYLDTGRPQHPTASGFQAIFVSKSMPGDRSR